MPRIHSSWSLSLSLACLALVGASACDSSTTCPPQVAGSESGSETSLPPEDESSTGESPPPDTPQDPEDPSWAFEDLSYTRLPEVARQNRSMEARAGDFDNDGDLDLILAKEWAPNALMLNQLSETGEFRYVDASERIPDTAHDSEDIALADFDDDGDLDIVVVSEDDQVNEYYENRLDQGGGLFFVEAGLPVTGTTNAVVATDLDGDGAIDLLLGNNGPNFALINDGEGSFVDQGPARLPGFEQATQDLVIGDLDGDGDQDLVVANESENRILLDAGGGMFEWLEDALPPTEQNEETRNADLGDVDGDGDLDLVFANVAWVPGSSPLDRLLLNTGNGHFELPPEDGGLSGFETSGAFTLDADFGDLDGDGDLDLVLTQLPFSPYRVLLNGGAGDFSEASSVLLPPGSYGEGIEVEIVDLDGDGKLDLYFSALADSDRLMRAL